MKVARIFTLLVILAGTASGQGSQTEVWRDSGYQALTVRDYPVAIHYYQRILQGDSADYDARLALGRLYHISQDYRNAIAIFQSIFSEDSADVEALNGLGKGYLATGKDSMAVVCFEKALRYLPGEVSQHIYLAEAYGNAGRMRDAIRVYQKANEIDSTYSEVWAGIGKMYYWLEKPVTSSRFYRKAIVLDPENDEIRGQYAKVRQESGFGVTLKVSPVQEKEENYTINAWITSLKVEKRISDHFRVEANFLLDHSDRDIKDDTGDTSRWYNSTWIKAGYLGRHHSVSVYGGYSSTDKLLSTYGVAWNLKYSPGKFLFKNALQLGYDYYYYWNHIGAKSVTDEISARYRFVEIGGSYSYGLTDPVYCFDRSDTDTGAVRENPHHSYGLSLVFTLLKKPEIRIGMTHAFLDYSYKSLLYYSPGRRQLTGPILSVYYGIRKFYLYGNFSYKIGSERNFGEKMKVDNWSALLEAGYELNRLSFSVGGSKFYNPYYENFSGFIAVKVIL